jgi:hypothetical protein
MRITLIRIPTIVLVLEWNRSPSRRFAEAPTKRLPSRTLGKCHRGEPTYNTTLKH